MQCKPIKSMVITNNNIDNRKNVLLLRDILPDVNMADNIDYDNLITIGFLNNPKDLSKEVKNYLTKYDVVIANEGSFVEVNRILKEIIPKTN